MYVEVTVYGPSRPLHSGHYGNRAPNPAMRLGELLGIKDAYGPVAIAGWYDDVEPLGAAERGDVAAPRKRPRPGGGAGDRRPARRGADAGGADRAAVAQRQGIRERRDRGGGAEGDPTQATAVLELRLVRGYDHRRQTEGWRSTSARRGTWSWTGSRRRRSSACMRASPASVSVPAAQRRAHPDGSAGIPRRAPRRAVHLRRADLRRAHAGRGPPALHHQRDARRPAPSPFPSSTTTTTSTARTRTFASRTCGTGSRRWRRS